MKKINLKGISEVLSEKEMKNVMGGSDCTNNSCGALKLPCCSSADYCSDASSSGYCKSRPR